MEVCKEYEGKVPFMIASGLSFLFFSSCIRCWQWFTQGFRTGRRFPIGIPRSSSGIRRLTGGLE